MRPIALALLLLAVACGAPAPQDVWTQDVLVEGNIARDMGHTCDAYPSVPQFAQRRSYPSGGQPLAVDPALEASAQAHADYMAATGDYQHQTMESIMAAGGMSENIANIGPITVYAADGSVQSTRPEPDADVGGRLVAAWLRSPGHCHNLMQPQWSRIGVGVALSQSGVHYGVQVFGG